MIATTAEPTTMAEATALIRRLRSDLESEIRWRKRLQEFQVLSHEQALRINSLIAQTHAHRREGYKAGWLAAGGDLAHIGAAEAAREADAMYGTRISGGAGRLGS